MLDHPGHVPDQVELLRHRFAEAFSDDGSRLAHKLATLAHATVGFSGRHSGGRRGRCPVRSLRREIGEYVGATLDEFRVPGPPHPMPDASEHALQAVRLVEIVITARRNTFMQHVEPLEGA